MDYKHAQQESLQMSLFEWGKVPLPQESPSISFVKTKANSASDDGSQAKLDLIFPGADCVLIDNVSELSSARHFELIPLCDIETLAYRTTFYDKDANTVQIRMGKDQHPSILVATYASDDSIEACDDFFGLVRFSTALWYGGYDIRCRVRSIEDMASQIVEDRLEEGDADFDLLLNALGLEPDDLDMTDL